MKETREELVARAHDAELQADDWKHTASRWRKKALQEGRHLRRHAREVQALYDELEEKHAALQTELADTRKGRLTKRESDALKERCERAEADAKNARYYMQRYHDLETQTTNKIAALNKTIEMERAKQGDARDAAAKAVAALRVVANRLGVKVSQDPHKLAGDVDAAVLKLQNQVAAD